MATNCNKELIAANLIKNCDDPVSSGIEKKAYIYNRGDLNLQTILASLISGSANTYSAFSLKAGKRGFQISNALSYINTKTDSIHETEYQKVVSGILLDDGTGAAEIIEAIGGKDNEFVIVVEHKFKDYSRNLRPASSAFEIIGLEGGLTSNGQSIVNDKTADTKGGWLFSLSCNEIKPRYYFYSTNYSASKTVLENSLFTGYEFISGLTIPEDGEIKLTVDSNKTCYAITPSGATITSTAGVIDYLNESAGGDVVLIVPENSSSIVIGNSDFAGVFVSDFKQAITIDFNSGIAEIVANSCASISGDSLTTLEKASANTALSVELTNCEQLTDVRCNSSVDTNLSGDALSTASIAEILRDAVTTGKEDGAIQFVGGTNSDVADWTDQALLDSSELTTNRGWEIGYNEA